MHIASIIDGIDTDTVHEPLKPIGEQAKERIKQRARDKAKEMHLEPSQALDAVIEYMPYALLARSKDKDSFITERRGLLLVGDPGLGKSMAMDFFACYSRTTVVNACEMMQRFSSGGDTEFFAAANSLKTDPVIIDDLGAEREITSYGNTSPMGEWIQERYESWQHGGSVTHIVTNLSKGDIEKRYGFRVLDRIYEFCIPTPIKGKSMRTSPIVEGACKYIMCAPNNRKSSPPTAQPLRHVYQPDAEAAQ